MTGEREDNGRCPLCGGRLAEQQQVTIPFVLGRVVVVVKDVPAAVCRNCGEPYLAGAETDRLLALLKHFARLPVEVSVTSYPQLMETEAVAL